MKIRRIPCQALFPTDKISYDELCRYRDSLPSNHPLWTSIDDILIQIEPKCKI